MKPKNNKRQPLPSPKGGADVLKKKAVPDASKRLAPQRRIDRRWGWLLFFAMAWLWASWWMGDTLRVAREWSFVAADSTLMHWLWQQSFGSLWIAGRWLLTLYRWPLVGGLVTAALMTLASWLVGYCLRLRPASRWHWLSYLPAAAWMTWMSWKGVNIYYHGEAGVLPGVLLLGIVVCGIDAVIIRSFKSGHHSTDDVYSVSPRRAALEVLYLVVVFVIPVLVTQLRHPWQRPVTQMQVQLLAEDWDGMAATARRHGHLSYRPLAAYYAIALVHNGHLTDQMFDIRLDYDSLRIHSWGGAKDIGTNYYLIDCDYHAGLFRAAAHKAMENLTMNGPTLYTLKHLTRLALLDHDWALARKYLFILKQTPFEGDFVSRYEAMLGKPEAVEADPVFAQLRKTEPVTDVFENMFEEPTFLGYTCALAAGRSIEALHQSLMACLYSKRMPDFLMRCQPLVGTTPPRTIAEGLTTQCAKEPNVLKAFPQLQMSVQSYRAFLQTVQPYMKDRARGGDELFDSYRGYYPYYYFFGNLKATRKRDTTEVVTSSAGVN